MATTAQDIDALIASRRDNASVTPELTRQVIEREAIAAARRNDLDPALYLGLIKAESAFNPKAVSNRDARGLAQLKLGAAREVGVDRDNPLENLEGGARYLKKQIDRFGSVEAGLAAYNAGPGRVQAAGGRVPGIRETQAYVPRVQRFAKGFLNLVSPSEAQAQEKESVDIDSLIQRRRQAFTGNVDALIEQRRRKVSGSVSETSGPEIRAVLELVRDQARARGVLGEADDIPEEVQKAVTDMFRLGVSKPKSGSAIESFIGRAASKANAVVNPLIFGEDSQIAQRSHPLSQFAFELGSQLSAQENLDTFGKTARLASRVGPDLLTLAATGGTTGLLANAAKFGLLTGSTEALRPGSTAGDIALAGGEGAAAGATFGALGKGAAALVPGSRLGQAGLVGGGGAGLTKLLGGSNEDAGATGLLFGGLQALFPGGGALKGLPLGQRFQESFFPPKPVSPPLAKGAFNELQGQGLAAQPAPEAAARPPAPFVNNPKWMDFASVREVEGGTVRGVTGRAKGGPEVVKRTPLTATDIVRNATRDLDRHLEQATVEIHKPANAGKNPVKVVQERMGDVIRRRTVVVARSAKNKGLITPEAAKWLEAQEGKPGIEAAIMVEGRTAIPSKAMPGAYLPPAGKHGGELSVADKGILMRTDGRSMAELSGTRKFAGNPERWMRIKHPVSRTIMKRLDRIDVEQSKMMNRWLEMHDDLSARSDFQGLPVPRFGIFAERNPPGKRFGQIRRLIPIKDQELISKAADGQADALKSLEARPDLQARLLKFKALMDEVAEVEGIAPGRRIGEYFTHYVNRMFFPGEGWKRVSKTEDLPVDVQAQIPKEQFFGPFSKNRTTELSPALINWRLWDVGKIYLGGASRKIAWDKFGGPEIEGLVKLLKARQGAEGKLTRVQGSLSKAVKASTKKGISEKAKAKADARVAQLSAKEAELQRIINEVEPVSPEFVAGVEEYVINFLGRNKDMQNSALVRRIRNSEFVGKMEQSQIEFIRNMALSLRSPIPATRFGRSARNIQFQAKLAVNSVFAAVNISQPLTAAASKLSTNSVTGKTVPLSGYHWLTRAFGWWATPNNRTERRFMVRDGILDRQAKYEYDLSSMSRMSRKAADATAMTVTLSEGHNWGWVYTAAFKRRMHDLRPQIKSGKLPTEQALESAAEFARQLTIDTQFRGGRLGTPLGFQRPILGLLFQFKQFTTKSAELFGQMNNFERAQYVAAVLALGGAKAFPLIRSFAEWIDPDDNYGFQGGLYGLLGLDVHHQYGISMWGLPIEGETVHEVMNDIAFLGMGPTAGNVVETGARTLFAAEKSISPSKELGDDELQQLLLSVPFPGQIQTKRIIRGETPAEKIFGVAAAQE